jgi:sugar phosphate isomerase/epimerase
MRLGGYFHAETIEDLEPLCATLDAHGLSAIEAPYDLANFSLDQCAAFGERARELGLVVGEAGYWENLLTPDRDLQARRIDEARALLVKVDAMGCRAFVSLVGTRDPSDHPLAPHPFLFTDDCKAEFREVLLRLLDGLDLATTTYVIEPWCNTFFYQPEEIRAFLDSVGHPKVGLHLDLMNMVSHPAFYRTTELIERTFALLGDRVGSVHLKDIRWDYEHMFLKWDEVLVGDGVIDYTSYLQHVARLPADITCYCEHFETEAEYVENFRRIHEAAERAEVAFLRRSVPTA